MAGVGLAFAVVLPMMFGPSAAWFQQPAHGSGATEVFARASTPGRPRATAGQSAAGLQVPASAFAPGIITAAALLSAAVIDNPQEWPRIHHSVPYSTWGLTDSYMQTARWTPPGSSDSVTFEYGGSVLATEPGAYQAWSDGTTYWPTKYNNILLVACPAVAAPVCSRWDLTGDNDIDEWDDSIQLGQCLIETRAFAPAALFNAQQTQIADTLATMDRAAITAAARVCRVPISIPSTTTSRMAVGIDALHIERNNAQPDWTLARPFIKRIRTGRALLISAYYTVRNAPAGALATFHVIVRTRRRVVLDQRDRPVTLSPSTTQYWHWVRFVPRSPGLYTVAATVGVGNLSASGSVSFRAV